MFRLGVIAIIGLPIAGCGAVTPPPDTARLPPNAFGTNADGDVGAINLAQWAFSDPTRTRGNPADGARAVAAVDYLAGELWTSPRWGNISPITKQMMLQARVEVRQAVGIAPNAPSQLVVNSLLAAGNALAYQDQAAALAALNTPIYAQPPEQTMQRLANLPYVQSANVASQRAAAEMFDSSSRGRWF